MSKRIIITGANRGIGLEIARQLGKMGHHIILGIRSPEKGKETQEKLASQGIKAVFYPLDLESEASIRSFTDHVLTEFDFIDVLINNAGVLIDSGKNLSTIPMEDFDKTFQINFKGPLLLTRQLLVLLKKSSNGRIINLSSGLGALNEMSSGYPAYRVSKAALNAMSAILGSELSNYNIRVNSMCPGWVKTDMGGSGASREVSKGAETAVWLATNEDIPNGRFLRDKKVIDW